jgi:hypothetical protein
MDQSDITAFLTELDGVDVVVASEAIGAPEAAWGDSFFFYDPDGSVPADRRMPFATIVTQDYEGFDTASDLDRPDVFRLNVWVSRPTFEGLFGTGGAGEGSHDFTALDTPLPHPIYGAQSWVSILNPGPATTDLARDLLTEAHALAVARHDRRAGR